MYQDHLTAQSLNKLAVIIAHDAEAIKLYQSAIDFKTKGMWRDSGDKLLKCAEVYLLLKSQMEAATIYTEAAESFGKVDKTEALRAYRLAIKVYCDIGRFDIAGKLERNVANINLQSKHWEEAAFHYKKAANFLSSDKLIDQSDICLDKAAECLIRIGEYFEACKTYEIIAKSCVNTNLRRFNARDYLLKALFCLIGIPVDGMYNPIQINLNKNSAAIDATPNEVEEPTMQFSSSQDKYEQIIIKCKQYEEIDFMWKCCIEYSFIKNIMAARLNNNLDEFIDQVYYWNNVKPLSSLMLRLSKTMLEEIQQEIISTQKSTYLASSPSVKATEDNASVKSDNSSSIATDPTRLSIISK
eukprot:gene7068-9647_t